VAFKPDLPALRDAEEGGETFLAAWNVRDHWLFSE
jgi:hypothetical protein